MSIILGIAAAVVAFVITAALTAMSKLIEEEIRGWIEVLPGIVLKMAAMQLDAAQRVTVYRDEWLPDLLFIARKTSGRPVTRFIASMRFALGMLRSGRRVARKLRKFRARELANLQVAASGISQPESPALKIERPSYRAYVSYRRAELRFGHDAKYALIGEDSD